MLRCVDVGNQPLNCAVIFRKELDQVTGENLEITELAGFLRERLQIGRQNWLYGHQRIGSRLDLANEARGPLLHRDSTGRQVDASKQRIKYNPRPGEQKDEQQPGA